MDILKYKNYEGTAEVDIKRCVCRGKILFINDLIIYESSSPAELQKAFEDAVDDYIETCAELGREAQLPLKGVFQVRVSPDLHKACIVKAKTEGIFLNEVVVKALTAYVCTSPAVNNNFHLTFVAPENATMATGLATGSQQATISTTRTTNATN